MGEPEGFRDFVAARSAALTRSAWLLTGDEMAAQDLVQVALVKTWARWARLARQDAPEAYVRRVMLSTFLTWNRRRWRGEFPVAAVPRPARATGRGRRGRRPPGGQSGAADATRPATGGGGLAVF